MIESFFGSMQIQLLDRRLDHPSGTGDSDLRIHRSLLQPGPPAQRPDYRSPIDYERHPQRHQYGGVNTPQKPSGEQVRGLKTGPQRKALNQLQGSELFRCRETSHSAPGSV